MEDPSICTYNSDSITHLIFKNGSTTTLRKALTTKHVSIVNLLWIGRCKREGKRLPEKDFLIDRPQSIALAGSKRRKSMEPGKVRGLMTDSASTGALGPSSPNERSHRLSEKFQSGSLKKRPMSTAMIKDAKDKRQKSRLELDGPGLSGGNSLKVSSLSPDRNSTSPQLSCDERIAVETPNWKKADRVDTDLVADDDSVTLAGSADPVYPSTNTQASSEYITDQRESPKSKTSAPRPQVRKEVKDEFYFGDMDNSTKLSRMSMSGGSILAPLRRKRRSLGARLSLGNVTRLDSSEPSIPTSISLSSTAPPTPCRTSLIEMATMELPKPSSPMARRSLPRTALPHADVTPSPTIVMTSIDEARRKQYANVIAQLGTYEITRSYVNTTCQCVV